MKHLIVCSDGTWQSFDQPALTNVARLAAHVDHRSGDGAAQIVYYDRGVGAAFTAGAAGPLTQLAAGLDRLAGGAFGAGLEAKIFDAYRFLAANYTAGDRIYVFGFSRGAYVARSLCGLMHASGLVRRDALDRLGEAWSVYRDPAIRPGSGAARGFRRRFARRAPVTLLGCFDTVGARGVPDLLTGSRLDRWLNRAHEFHDCTVNDGIERARHACALDEDRAVFAPTPMVASAGAAPGQVLEMWFPGWHGGVGGGEAAARPFADSALAWMAAEARAAGLSINPALEAELAPDPLAAMTAPRSLNRFGRRPRSPGSHAALHHSVHARWRGRSDWRPAALDPLRIRLESAPAPEVKSLPAPGGLYEQEDHREHHRAVDGSADQGRGAPAHARFSRLGPAAAGAMAVS